MLPATWWGQQDSNYGTMYIYGEDADGNTPGFQAGDVVT